MFFSRDKLFLAGFLLAFAIVPAFAQIGDLQEPSLGGSPQFPGAPPQIGPEVKRPENGVIMGTVRTLDDKPVTNARVVVTSLQQQRLITEYTSTDGSFVVNSVPTGEYELRAESGVLEASARVRVDDGQTWVTLRMPASPTRGGSGSPPTVSVQQLRVPEKAASFLAKAQQALMKNHLEEAGKYVSHALAAYPEYAQALAFRGVLEMQQQQFEQAAADANHAIQADPNHGTGYLVMGAALNCQQKFQDALRPLERAEMLMPNAWQGYFESSKALLQMGSLPQALQQVNKAFSLADPSTHPDLYMVRGYVYIGLHSYGAALTELQKYLSQAPNGPHAAEVRATVEKVRPLVASTVEH
ncbi:MAG TPA: carboxypeptidase regulatory-like domain-containing protein [Terriglobales bacterium]|nr:carboxypeptidase regulatory-like domain-containing protein [Terriglobales bacterium]